MGRAGAALLIAGFAGLTCACGGRQVSSSVGGSEPAPPAVVAESQAPDYATQRAAWIITHQPDEPNRWAELTNELARVQGAWNYFVVTNADVRAWEAVDADTREGAFRPLMIFTPEAKQLLPAVSEFVRTLNTMRTWETLARLSADGSFVAARPVEPLLDEQFAEVSQSRLMAQLLVVRMRTAVGAGDMGVFISSLDQGWMLARAVGGRGTVLSGLVGLAIDSLMLNEIKRAVLAGPMEAAACQQVLAALAARRAPMDIGVAFGGERYSALDAIDRYFERVDEDVAQEMAAAPAEILKSRIDAMSAKGEQIRLANRLFDGAVQSRDSDPSTRAAAMKSMDEILAKIEADPNPTKWQPLSLMLPAFGKARDAQRKRDVELGGVRIMLELEVFKSGAGRYPQSLSDLLPTMPEVPRDPYAPDQPMAYRLTDDAGGYVLYTVGLDGEDNQGVEHPQNAFNALGSLTGKGFDFVINRVRE